MRSYPCPHPLRRTQNHVRVGVCLLLGFAVLSLFAILGSSLSAHAQTGAAAPSFQVVVHGDHPEDSVDRKFLARAFLKKTTTWPDGSPIRPVDQRTETRVRQRFSEDVLQRSILAVRNYWQQLIFAGRGVPPPELESDDAVIRYVLRYRGAVGYVTGTANVGSAKTLTLR